jgi:hypothetical protein
MRFAISILILSVFSLAAYAAADKKLPIEDSSNEYVEIQASLILDKDQIKQVLGSDLGGSFLVVKMRVRPLTDKPWKIDRDDFLLLDGNLGQRSVPYAPSQIAGNSSLVVTQEGVHGAVGAGRPTWGIGMGGGGMGSGTTSTQQAKVTVQESDKKEDTPLLKVLKEKVLPEKEITDPIEGLLYFQIDGKVKAKDLELYYKTPGGKLAMRFRP